MSFDFTDKQEKRMLELQNEYIYLKAKDWLRNNHTKSNINWGFEK